MSYFQKIMLVNFLISILFLVDRLTKWFAFQISDIGLFLISQKFCGLKLYKNFNLVFNIKIYPPFFYFLVCVIILILLLFLIKNYRKRNFFLIFSFSLVLIGAISNLIDRVMWGYVVDFLFFFDYSIFNLSDVYIVTGIGLIFIYELRHSKKVVKEV